jgi:hypothetical protein
MEMHPFVVGPIDFSSSPSYLQIQAKQFWAPSFLSENGEFGLFDYANGSFSAGYSR